MTEQTPSQPPTLWLSPADAASRIGVHRQTVDAWLREWRDTRGRSGLPHARLGDRCIRIQIAALDAYMAAQVALTARAASHHTNAA